MLKFTEQLAKPAAKKIFTDVAINELKDLVKNKNKNKKEPINTNDFDSFRPSNYKKPESTDNQFIDQVIEHQVIEHQEFNNQPQLDITTPARVPNVNLAYITHKNLFSLPSIITVLFFVLSTIYVDYDAALEDGRISRRERLKIMYLLLGAVATLVSRGSEGRSAPTVPNWMPGPHKKDYNHDGVIDDEDYQIYLNSKNKDNA